MRGFIRTGKLLACTLVMSAVFLLGSCIRDDRSDCYDPDRFLLYVKVVDTETGEDITETGDTEEVMLALFDDAGRFVATRFFDREEIRGRRPWEISEFDMQGVHVSAWGDLGNSVEQADPAGVSAGAEFVTLSVDSDGYSPSPDDFFFGYRQIGAETRATQSGEVVITQKNSKVHITVRGLTELDPDEYYFVIEAPQNGYDFFGNPNDRLCRVLRSGEFNADGELCSPLPYLMIHSADPDNVGPDEGARVRLYRRFPDGDREIATAEKTDSGSYIGLPSGKTTNILIDLSGGGSLSVRVEVTGWREVYLWSEW